jgi:hypothetical protein
MNTQKSLFLIGKLLIIGTICYFGIISIVQPELFTRMIPSLFSFLPATLLIIVHAVVMTIAAVCVLFSIGGKWAYYVLLATLLGVLISVSGMTLARDLAIFGAVLVLFSSSYIPRK